MRTLTIITMTLALLLLLGTGCKKELSSCVSSGNENPFLEKFNWVSSNISNEPYKFTFLKKQDFLNLVSSPAYSINGTLSTPLEDSGFAYLIVADTLFDYTDTITGVLYRDSCLKTLTYNVKFIQRSKNRFQYLGAISITSIIGNVTPDYRITINKERVNLP